jgi:hypothetical protein
MASDLPKIEPNYLKDFNTKSWEKWYVRYHVFC